MNSPTYPVFEAPSDENIKIWRYMDFTKFVSLLDQKCLYFSRSDQFEDTFEGTNSKANINLRAEVYKDSGIPDEVFETMAQLRRKFRTDVFINSWHMNEYESEAMWKLYARSKEAIAIQSTYKSLKDGLPEGINIGTVKYIDYNTEWISEQNLLAAFVSKRKSFEHEREIRAVISYHSTNPATDIGRLVGLVGRAVEVDLNDLIHNVYVAPNAPGWFLPLVKNITAQYGLQKQVSQSSLDEEPVY